MKKFQKIFESTSGHFMSGYFSKNIFNDEKVLAIQADFVDRLPGKNDKCSVGYFDLRIGSFTKVAESKCFNWQQGNMLEWLGMSKSKILFNDYDAGGFCSKIVDVDSAQIRRLDYAIYASSLDGGYAASIDFERHYWCRRAYSYGNVENIDKDAKVGAGDSLKIFQIQNGTVIHEIFVADLIKLRPKRSMEDATHYIEHIEFSPDSKNFYFYHRWKTSGGTVFARLLVASTLGGIPKIVFDGGRLSHACWLSSYQILAWCSSESALGNFRSSDKARKYIINPLMPIYRSLVRGNPKVGQTKVSRALNGDSYRIINIDTLKSESVLPDILDRDGHPCSRGLRAGFFVTDTYPTREGFQHLYLVESSSRTVCRIDSIPSFPPVDESILRCDLHPKTSNDGKLLAVDTMVEGIRGIKVYELTN